MEAPALKLTVSPLLAIGLILFVAYAVVDRVFVTIPDWLAFPMLIISVVFIILGGLRVKRQE